VAQVNIKYLVQTEFVYTDWLTDFFVTHRFFFFLFTICIFEKKKWTCAALQ
jgi:hypothetical protein